MRGHRRERGREWGTLMIGMWKARCGKGRPTELTVAVWCVPRVVCQGEGREGGDPFLWEQMLSSCFNLLHL